MCLVIAVVAKTLPKIVPLSTIACDTAQCSRLLVAVFAFCEFSLHSVCVLLTVYPNTNRSYMLFLFKNNFLMHNS